MSILAEEKFSSNKNQGHANDNDTNPHKAEWNHQIRWDFKKVGSQCSRMQDGRGPNRPVSSFKQIRGRIGRYDSQKYRRNRNWQGQPEQQEQMHSSEQEHGERSGF